MLRRWTSNGAPLLFFSLILCASAFAQSPKTSAEIPIERCDVLPIVKVRIDGADMRFLLDTAATSMLNLKSFSSGRSKEIQITSWSGTSATSAREVFLPEILFGDHRLRDLRLPAIDLSPIGKACGGKIDGIIGVDLLDRMGVTIDLRRRVASVDSVPRSSTETYKQMDEDMHHCTTAFESGNAGELGDCLDSDIVLFALQREYRGREEVMKYLLGRFLQYAPQLTYKMKLDDVKLFGDALWYTYEYEIISPNEHLVGRGISICRKTGDRWRILNMHNSLREPAVS